MNPVQYVFRKFLFVVCATVPLHLWYYCARRPFASIYVTNVLY